MTEKLAIVINASAGEAKAAAIAREAQQRLWGWPMEFFIGQDIEATRVFIRQLRADEFKAIIVAGGDGTLNQLLGAIQECGLPVATFPSGTANDLAREAGISRDWEDLQTAIDLGSMKKIDLINVNGVDFATVGGIGVGASLTNYVNSMRANHYWFRKLWKVSRSRAYSAIAAKKVLMDRDFIQTVRITTPDFDQEMKVSSILICNQGVLGGDMLITPESKNDDGKFEIVVTAADRKVELLRSLLAAKSGKGLHYNYLIETDSCRIESTNGQKIQVFGDGETLIENEVVEFKLKPAQLPILTPPKRRRNG